MNEPVREIDDDHDVRERRRAALATIMEERADPILERIVSETVRATEFAGLGRAVAARFAMIARASLPVWLTALGAPDHERARIFEHNTHYVREMLGHGIPKFVQRSLVSFGFRLANTAARDAASEHGFKPDELEQELRVFQRDLETRLFYGA
jgi:hypothetical protein